MSTELGLAIRRKSATPASSTGIRRNEVEIAKLVDIDLCIGCKACEVACKEWNNLPADNTSNFGSYQSHEDLTASTWDLMRFKEIELDGGDLAWLIRKDSCLHCDDPGCLAACPADAAPEVLHDAHLVTRAPGGRGAIREVVETILKQQGTWDGLVARYRAPE